MQMMYVKYQLREPNGLVVPKGPDFSRARIVRCFFDGTELRFKAPKHRSHKKRLIEIRPERQYRLDTISQYFRSYGDDRRETPSHQEYFELFERYWSFYGPWFTGAQALLNMSITLIMPVNFDQNFSLYHPRAFEKILGDYLTRLYFVSNDLGPDHPQFYNVPTNWQPLTYWPVPAARLEAVPNSVKSNFSRKTFLFFTLSDKILAGVMFYPSRLLNMSKLELDKRISEAPMIELMNQIIDSFELHLSDEARRQQQAAVAGLEDTSLVKDYPPLNWSTIPAPGNKRLDRE